MAGGAIMQRSRGGGRLILLSVGSFCAYYLLVPGTFQPLAQVPAVSSGLDDVEEVSFGAQIGQLVADNSELSAAVVLLLCFLVSTTERRVTTLSGPPLEKRGDYNGVLFMNGLLSLASGMLNALAFLELGATIAHHTGNMTHWGRNWGTDSFKFGCYLFFYLLGGGVVGFIKSDAEALFAARYSPSLLSSTIAVLGGTAISMLGGKPLACLALWSFAQGLQNCLCRKFSSMPLCSTHFTGYLSDAGHGLGSWVRAKQAGESPPNMKKTALFFLCMFSFALGGFIAKVGRDSYGISVAVVPALLMAAAAKGLFPVFPQEEPQTKKK